MAEGKRPPDAPTETVLLIPGRTPVPGDGPGMESLGGYRIERRLGQGGMGEVFLAWDDRLGRRVAIKRIRRDSSSVPNLHQRILQEARAAAGLSHPAIVQVHDLVEDASGIGIVLEYVEGRTLAEHLSAGPLGVHEALCLAREIAEGLAAAHAAGIVHRDLKAGNVIVTPAGHAKILDFGLARMVSRPSDETLTQQGVVLGTVHAMSPEQASGREVDARSDLFSLGALLYEMLTGRSPFRGKDILETLKRLATEDPPAASSIRPEIPARLSALVERLLEKEPEDRPGSAAEVAAALAEIEAGTPDLRPSAALRLRHPLNRRAASALVAAIAALSGTAWVLLQRPAEPLRVVVPEPVVEGTDPRLGLAASGLLAAALDGLTSIEGVAPLDPTQLRGIKSSALEMAKTAAADEVLFTSLRGAGGLGRVTLRRVQGSDGRVLWSDTFDIPIEAQSLRSMAEAVSARLRRGYSGRGLRPGVPRPGARAGDADYAAFLEVTRRIDAGRTPPKPELAELERILASSPGFLEARLTAASVSLSLYRSTRKISYRNRALAHVAEARKLAPDDPRPVEVRFKIALEGDPPDVARELLAELEELRPASPELLPLRADLAERLGRMDEALEARRAAVERAPSWRNLYALAQLEARTGRAKEARRHFESLLRMSEGNLWVLEQLAYDELLFGDLERAEMAYLRLIAKAPSQAAFFTNLGVARSLLGRHKEAVEAYEQALAIEPDDANTTLNLADSRLALGQVREARALYRRVSRLLDRNRPPGGLDPVDGMIEAQCLAHLGKLPEALAITRESLRRRPGDPTILYSAALVHTLAGDLGSARAYARKALELGMEPRFFAAGPFADLRDDPQIRPLLARPAGPAARR
jgi:tetratricopeptide (TPR) repeat protein